jgi:hypothetical protein
VASHPGEGAFLRRMRRRRKRRDTQTNTKTNNAVILEASVESTGKNKRKLVRRPAA